MVLLDVLAHERRRCVTLRKIVIQRQHRPSLAGQVLGNVAACILRAMGKVRSRRSSVHFSRRRHENRTHFPGVWVDRCASLSAGSTRGVVQAAAFASLRVTEGSRCWRWRCGLEGGSLKLPFTAFTDGALETLAILCVRFEQVNNDLAEVEKSFL